MIDKEKIQKEIVWEETRFGLGDRNLRATYKGRVYQSPKIEKSGYRARQMIEEAIFQQETIGDIMGRLYNKRRAMMFKSGISAKYAIFSRDVWDVLSCHFRMRFGIYVQPGTNLSIIEGGLVVTVVDGNVQDFVDVA